MTTEIRVVSSLPSDSVDGRLQSSMNTKAQRSQRPLPGDFPTGVNTPGKARGLKCEPLKADSGLRPFMQAHRVAMHLAAPIPAAD